MSAPRRRPASQRFLPAHSSNLTTAERPGMEPGMLSVVRKSATRMRHMRTDGIDIIGRVALYLMITVEASLWISAFFQTIVFWSRHLMCWKECDTL